MPIRLSCPRCQKPMAVDDRYVGRQVQCPGCRAPVMVGSPPPANRGAGKAPSPNADSFDFYGQEATTGPDTRQQRSGPEAAGWRRLAGGLGNVWLGSGLQVLAVTVVPLVAGIIFGTGARLVSVTSEDEPAPVNPVVAGAVANIAMMASILGTLLAGTLLRLVGFVRCLGTPAESGARGLAVGMLACELLLLAAVGASAAGTFLFEPLLVLGGAALVALTALVGLILLLLFLRQIGDALQSKQVSTQVKNFVSWFIGGIIAAAAVLGLQFGLPLVLGAEGATRLLSALPCGWLLIVGFVGIVIPLVLLVKYLGLLTLASDQIRKRVGKVGRA